MRPAALTFEVPICDVTMAETLALVDLLVESGRARGTAHQIATVNVDFLVNALDDAELMRILQTASVCLADGMPVVWSAGWMGMPIAERVAGADLVPELTRHSAATGLRIHVVGSAPAVVERARQWVDDHHPRAHVTFDPGPMLADPTDVPESFLASIRAVDPDVLCVAFGNPKQERFIAAHRDRLGVPVMIGIGGSLDMLVGERRRAPGWVQAVGLEWVVRAAQEPLRLGRRYLRDIIAFGPRLVRELLDTRRDRDRDGLVLNVGDETVVVSTTDDPTTSLTRWPDAVRAIDRGASLAIGGSTTGLGRRPRGALLALARLAAWHGRTIEITGDDCRTTVGDLERFGIHPTSRPH